MDDKYAGVEKAAIIIAVPLALAVAAILHGIFDDWWITAGTFMFVLTTAYMYLFAAGIQARDYAELKGRVDEFAQEIQDQRDRMLNK